MKHLVVTGGQGALGRAIQEAFESPDWKIATPGRAELDVSDPASIGKFFEDRPVDLLVCAAGMILDAPLTRLDESGWEKVVTVNYEGAARCARAVLPGMIGRKMGHIVFISSHSAVHPPSGQAAYATAKAALLGISGSLARLHGGENIRVNSLLPGFLETPMTAPVSAKRRQDILEDHALGRFNGVAEAAGFIRYLHERLPHTSGQVFQLDSRC